MRSKDRERERKKNIDNSGAIDTMKNYMSWEERGKETSYIIEWKERSKKKKNRFD